jgi:RHS repeat-associated protein
VIQGSEYYPFGVQAATSWTRQNSVANNFLYNGGTELNKTTQVYDLYYRNYDPVLGRFGQVDPMASTFAPVSCYVYANNNPIRFNDRLGASPVTRVGNTFYVDWNEVGNDGGHWTPSGYQDYKLVYHESGMKILDFVSQKSTNQERKLVETNFGSFFLPGEADVSSYVSGWFRAQRYTGSIFIFDLDRELDETEGNGLTPNPVYQHDLGETNFDRLNSSVYRYGLSWIINSRIIMALHSRLNSDIGKENPGLRTQTLAHENVHADMMDDELRSRLIEFERAYLAAVHEAFQRIGIKEPNPSEFYRIMEEGLSESLRSQQDVIMNKFLSDKSIEDKVNNLISPSILIYSNHNLPTVKGIPFKKSN